jgi:hypothetical protein
MPSVGAVVTQSGGAATLPATRSRRLAASAFRPVGLTREQEYSYIRSDMKRLIFVAAGLLALMLLILVVVTR